MKAEELMIGDWIRITDDDTDSFFDARVGTLTRVENIFVVPPGEEMAQPFSIDCVEPISLTPDILEKNGFNLTTFDGKIGKFWEIPEFVMGEFGRTSIGQNNIEIKYVHELQHILRLCGIEKQIVI